jgi:penicillin-binding protein 2
MAGPPVIDRRTTATRLTTLSVAVIVAFCALAVGFWYFQVVENATYLRMAENNHLRRLSLRAPRGVLFDRDGTLLVENRDAFTISILREHSADLDQTIHRLSAAAGVDELQVRETIRRHRG